VSFECAFPDCRSASSSLPDWPSAGCSFSHDSTDHSANDCASRAGYAADCCTGYGASCLLRNWRNLDIFRRWRAFFLFWLWMVRHKWRLLNIFVRYKDTSDDKVDIALTNLKMPCDTHQRPTRDFESEKHCQLFGTDNETLSVAMRISDDGPWFAAAICKANFLKQAEQFEDDYDNNNYSDYVEDASVHAMTDIRLGLRWPAFIQNEAVFTAFAAGFILGRIFPR
jgi:hypothetical protein